MKNKITTLGFAVLVAAIVFGLTVLSLAGCDSGSGITGAEPLSEKYTVVKGGKTYELTITQSPANAKAKASFPAEGDSYVLKITEKDVAQTSSGTVKANSNNKFTLAASNNSSLSFEVTVDKSAITKITGTITLQDGTTITGPGSLTTSGDSGGGGNGGGGGGSPGGTPGGTTTRDLSGTISISPSGSVAINTELTATYSGSETVSFQWKKDGSNVGTASTTKPNKFTPTQAGSYTVTVSASGYNSKTSAAVTVTGGGTPINPTFAITMQNDGNGTATASPNPAEQGEEVTITATHNSGYEFKEWQVVSGGVTLSHSTANPTVFTMPGNAVTIKATFALIPPNTPSLSLAPPSFDDVNLGYAAQTAKNITITNGGTGIANVTSIALDSAGNAAFTLGGTSSITTLAVGGTATFTVQPKTGLSGGAHEGTITISYDGKTAEAEVSFIVRDGSLAHPYLVRNATEWNAVVSAIADGGNGMTYYMEVTGNFSIPGYPYGNRTFGTVTGITVNIQGTGKISLATGSTGSLLYISGGQTVSLKDVHLEGNSTNNTPLVQVEGGSATFNMTGGTISGNISSQSGGGVVVSGGTFNMSGGVISGNTSTDGAPSAAPYGGGGGVYITAGGTFNMSGTAEISGNKATGNYGGGGGVHLCAQKNGENGTFNMTGGTITGNEATGTIAGYGGGVWIAHGSGTYSGVTFTLTMTGGSITGNTGSWGGGICVDTTTTVDLKSLDLVVNNIADPSEGKEVWIDSSATFNVNGIPFDKSQRNGDYWWN